MTKEYHCHQCGKKIFFDGEIDAASRKAIPKDAFGNGHSCKYPKDGKGRREATWYK